MSAASPRHGRSPFRFLMRVPVPWVFVLAYLLGLALEYLIPVTVVRRSPLPLGAAGGIVLALGIVVAGWGWGLFRAKRTTTVPGEASSTLVTWGPYRISRNPMYVGLAIAYLGEALLLRHVWPVVLLPLTLAYLNWVVIPVEEGRLREVFGRQYDAYRLQARRWL